MTKHLSIFCRTVASLIVAVHMVSCTSEYSSITDSRSVTFAAAISKDSKVDTRAGIIFDPVGESYKSIPFYIYAEVETTEGIQYECATYQVTPGMLGRLTAMDGQKDIVWYNKTANHTFYAWTMPWQEDDDPTDPKVQISFLPSTYQNMERFVATKTNAINYNINGELVEMYFQHLVSKININVTRLVGEGNNFSGEGAEALMTFIDMPQEGTFYRRPNDSKAPYVKQLDGGATGVTCSVGTPTTTLYVCPEIDFSNMRFSIHFNNGSDTRSDYYGDFKSVIFKRPDEELGNWDNGKSSTVLYAGEEMTINFIMQNDELTNFTVNINPWTEKKDRTGTSNVKQGVYTSTELQDIYNKFAGGSYTPKDVEEIFDLFGVEEYGQKVIYMYEDLITSHGHFPLDPTFILDGLGHILQMRNTTRKFPGGERPYCAQVPLCRNIFLTNGEHMIYIDEYYHIWKVNPETLAMTDTGKDLTPNPLPNGKRSYYIDYETGDVDTSSTV